MGRTCRRVPAVPPVEGGWQRVFHALEDLVQSLKEALNDLGFPPAVRTVTELWEGAATPHVEVIVSVGRDQQSQTGPVADLYIYPVQPQTCEVEVEVTLPAHLVAHLPPAELYARAKDLAGTEVGISGIQRYFRGESGKTIHVHMESHFIIDYWFQIDVPTEGEATDADWEEFDDQVSAIARGVVGLLGLAEDQG